VNSSTVANSPTLADCEPGQLVADLFHALSQPLTTLCCSLELTLQQAATVEEYRECVIRALADAERVSWLSTGIRELLEAGHAGEDCESLQLQPAVQAAIDDLLLLADSTGVRICYLPGAAGPVWFEARRLRQGLFHVLGFAVSAGGEGAVVRIEVVEAGEEVVLALTVSDEAHSSKSAEDEQLALRLGLGIARATFEAAGGSFRVERGVDCLGLEVRLGRNIPDCD
jgi:signal transduction histidine kinase